MERKLTKALQTQGPGMDFLIKGYRGHVGVTDRARVYVTTCSLGISLKTQTEPDSFALGLPSKAISVECLHLKRYFIFSVVFFKCHQGGTGKRHPTMQL